MLNKQLRELCLLTVFVTGFVTTSVIVPVASSSSVAQAQEGNFSTVRNPQQVPTARYGRGEAVDLSLIIDEWRDRYPSIPVFACSCNADTCGDESVWPFRTYRRYQPFVALGPDNAAKNETDGFNCFEIESGDRP